MRNKPKRLRGGRHHIKWILRAAGYGDYYGFCHTRLDALLSLFKKDIDPFYVALGFPGFHLVKRSDKCPVTLSTGSHRRATYRRYSLTRQEKAFLARRLAQTT